MLLHEFADKINEILPELFREMLRQGAGSLYNIKLTMPQFVILDFLKRHGDSKMTDMAGFLHVTKAAVTGVVDRLVRDGYAKRLNDSNDRRLVKVGLTSEGNKAVAQINLHRRKTIIEIFGKISQRERDAYLRILLHIKEHLNKA